jgi:hypothetical protein
MTLGDMRALGVRGRQDSGTYMVTITNSTRDKLNAGK